MDLRDYLRTLRARWRIFVLCVALGGALGAAYVIHAPRMYQSQTQLFVSTSTADEDLSAIFQGGQFSQARVRSYADVVGGPRVADQIASEIGGGLTANTVEKEISSTAPPNTVLLNVTVTDRSPQRAQQIAAGVGRFFPDIVKDIETSDSSGQSPVKVSVVKPATFSASPVSPNIRLDIGLALVVGLLAGLSGAVLRETLDNSVKSAEDIEAVTGRSVIGVIAFDPGAKDQPLVVLEDLHGTRAEAFRQLRTNLQFVDVDSPLRSIVCTSSVPGEGKTTTICNLAITLAQTGMRVLLMEADLRRPRVGLYLGLDNAVGLTNVLIGATAFDDAVQQWGPDNLLDVLPSGPTPPNPSELLGSRGMADLLDSLEKRYDIVLLDAPPLLPVTDAAVLAVETSGAVLVVHHGQTRREQLENSTQALSAVGARVLGTVINFAPRKGPEAYYYGYAYSYRRAATDKAPRRGQPVATVGAAPEPTVQGSTPAESVAAPEPPRAHTPPIAPDPAPSNSPHVYGQPAEAPTFGEARPVSDPATSNGASEETPLWPEKPGSPATPYSPYSPGGGPASGGYQPD
ncbi:MAG TPA: polysaccharide biosynthesis tyrosine autokinase [Mycobacteriales bacterium]|nr:polysaccharide biosynthesis tyrosine autokinase [Mycobacteriales bacterium]